MLLDEIGARLSTQSIASSSGVDGWLLVQSFMPDSTAMQDKVVALIETPGGPPSPRVEIDFPSFQVRVRGDPITTTSTSYQETRQKIEDIKLELHGIDNLTLSSRYYVMIVAEQEPFLLEYDAQDRPHLACNFTAWRSRTT